MKNYVERDLSTSRKNHNMISEQEEAIENLKDKHDEFASIIQKTAEDILKTNPKLDTNHLTQRVENEVQWYTDLLDRCMKK